MQKNSFTGARNIDLPRIFAYNRYMKKRTAKKERKKSNPHLLRALLTALCVALLAFIFGNSAMPADESAAQSDFITDLVQKILKVFAPNSWAANATGADYERLHSIIRTLAHFSEFALLGALLVFTFRSYTRNGYAFVVCVCLIILIPILDETLQAFTSGRVADLADLYVDTLGGVIGGLFAALAVCIVGGIIRKKRKTTV